MRFVPGKDRSQWFIIPTFGVIYQNKFTGCRRFSLAFAWLSWRCKIMFGVDKWGIGFVRDGKWE